MAIRERERENEIEQGKREREVLGGSGGGLVARESGKGRWRQRREL